MIEIELHQEICHNRQNIVLPSDINESSSEST